ncbi:MAG: hypothetical protein VXW91_05640, partial [Pseudomonadota bacterium]|nr:hypothetical protein [Pseudomonadota bacterium]
MRRFKKFLLCFSLLTVVSACTSNEVIKGENPQLVASPDKVSAMLAQAADRASVALETLAAV